MKKLGLILAGAALFDLGTVVASGHAADSIFMKTEKTGDQKAQADKQHKSDIPIDVSSFKSAKAGEPSIHYKIHKAEASGIPAKHVGTTSGDTAPEAPTKK